MVGTIGAATSGFGGVAGYCCGGGGGGEEREEEQLPGLSGAKEEERERDDTGSLSASKSRSGAVQGDLPVGREATRRESDAGRRGRRRRKPRPGGRGESSGRRPGTSPPTTRCGRRGSWRRRRGTLRSSSGFPE